MSYLVYRTRVRNTIHRCYPIVSVIRGYERGDLWISLVELASFCKIRIFWMRVRLILVDITSQYELQAGYENIHSTVHI